jgi:hypothetical protein
MKACANCLFRGTYKKSYVGRILLLNFLGNYIPWNKFQYANFRFCKLLASANFNTLSLKRDQNQQMKQLVTLHFPSIQNLYDFIKEVGANNFEVSLRALLITCECTAKHIELATTKYRAKIVEGVKGRQNAES